MPQGYYIESEKDYNEQEKERLLSQKEELLAEGMSESDFSALIEQLDINHDEIYIIDEENQVRQVVEKPWAKDANGEDLFTKYTIQGTSIVQYVEFDENTAFPILADPKVGTTKSFSIKISNETMGLPSLAGTPMTAAAKKILKQKTKKKIIAVVGSKFVPGLNIASWVLSAAAYINYKTGKKGVKVSGTMIYRKTYMHKEGYYIYGWEIKSMKVSRY